MFSVGENQKAELQVKILKESRPHIHRWGETLFKQGVLPHFNLEPPRTGDFFTWP